MRVKVLRPSNFDSVPLSTASARGRAGQQKVTWSHISAASLKFSSRPTRHVPINYLNLQGEIFQWMKRHDLKLQGRNRMAGLVKVVLRYPNTERSHSHPGMLIAPDTRLPGIFQYPFFFNGIVLDHKRSLKTNWQWCMWLFKITFPSTIIDDVVGNLWVPYKCMDTLKLFITGPA